MKPMSISTGVLIMTTAFLHNGMPSAGPNTGANKAATATFAGGCFWCMVPPFEKLPCVTKVVSGYTGGKKEHPTYEEVSSGTTGHVEAVEVHYDPSKVSYDDLLDAFWRNINPTDKGGQFADRGTQYGTAIFYHTQEQKRQAEASRKKLDQSGKFEDVIVTPILPAKTFYPAEEPHQKYHMKNPLYYKRYREGSGRAPYLRRLWKDQDTHSKKTDTKQSDALQQIRPPNKELKDKLTEMQYNVAVCSATEPPFKNEYWDNHREGIYVDIISGEALFSSTDKFNSGTGWPSFTRPIKDAAIVEKEDTSHSMQRIEVRGKTGDSHLGHVFPDGPAPTGMRYCINSASLKFIPKEELEEEGYGKYRKLFK